MISRIKILVFSLGLLSIAACKKEVSTVVYSPDKTIKISFQLDQNGQPQYEVFKNDQAVILPSSMGFDLKDSEDLKGDFVITTIDENSVNDSWEMPWGEQKEVVDHYNEQIISLEETTPLHRGVKIYFKAYNDGIGFRYEFLEQEGVSEIVITEENTEFNLSGDHKTWWIPGDWEIYEHLYNETKLSEIDALSKRNHPDLNSSYIPNNAVNTPVTMKTDTGLYLSFHEANLTDYAGMTLGVNTENHSLKSILVKSDIEKHAVKRSLPFKTPWRTIQISDNAAGLIDSKLIVNLNEPNKLGDVSYFQPMKYVGIWWEMHIGKSTWDYEATQSMNSFFVDGEEKKSLRVTHGATTENAKRYIDFASKNGMKGLLVEGWYTGWDHWIGFDDREGVFDFVTEYPDYDLSEVVRYGKEKGVDVIMHHETSAAPRTYEKQLDTAYALMKSLGIHSVKTGYVGKLLPKGEYHHGQWMVNHYRKVVETAAKYYIAVNAHEPIKATGIRRTYPNVIAREGLRGQEFNAWASDGGNPAHHLPTVAFTRMLSGPIDFTPGVFELSLKTKPNNQINTTLAQQLALYVVVNSPIQMACDLPENYEGHPAFQFIRDVGVNWKQSKTLDGEVGDFVSIAREERETGNWFVGSITDESAREITIDYNFLEEGVSYKAIIYKDGSDADYKSNPFSYEIVEDTIVKGDQRTYQLASGGGVAISLMK